MVDGTKGPEDDTENTPDGKPEEPYVYCCKMREKYVVSVVAVNQSLPDPVDIIDYIDFDNKSPNGKPIICLAFCPWCSTKLPRDRHRLFDIDKDDEGDEWKSSTAD